ncbi:hypothetical protein [Rhabdothermincola salaria]|uniref:hypothetical protein n=1 Tax=Rhabdothermincola salaria TaxID=2903142 RepID=UPI001E2DD7CC|nr:hypothetical protein [Rhabdothermincola salaria]MCD9625335.1 hypothetical protein [Rhabdothermincola salaria]
MTPTRWRSARWDRMPVGRKILLMAFVAVRISLTVSALVDLADRPAESVRGKKRTWALAIVGVDIIGPLAYYWRGRSADPTTGPPAPDPVDPTATAGRAGEPIRG